MSKIIATVEISGVEEWNVDWNKDKSNQLKELKDSIKNGISAYGGIFLDNIHIELELKEAQP